MDVRVGLSRPGRSQPQLPGWQEGAGLPRDPLLLWHISFRPCGGIQSRFSFNCLLTTFSQHPREIVPCGRSTRHPSRNPSLASWIFQITNSRIHVQTCCFFSAAVLPSQVIVHRHAYEATVCHFSVWWPSHYHGSGFRNAKPSRPRDLNGTRALRRRPAVPRSTSLHFSDTSQPTIRSEGNSPLQQDEDGLAIVAWSQA